MTNGVIKRFSRSGGYGFITEDETDENLFFHVKDIVGSRFYLKPGTKVRFTKILTEKGWRAVQVNKA